MALVVAGCGGSDSEPIPELGANIWTSDEIVRIENAETDTFGWVGVDISLNSRYRYRQPEIVTGQVVDIPLRDFVNLSGERFNIYDRKITSISIRAQVTVSDGENSFKAEGRSIYRGLR